MSDLTIYGASDDLVEFDGEIVDEFDVHGPWRGRLTAPDGQSLIITAEFGKPGAASEWTIGVENDGFPFPDWPMDFHDRPDREGDPALHLVVPRGTTVASVSS